MIKYLVMAAVCLLVAGMQTFLFFWFLRRLSRIEDARWGELRKRGHWG
jgi:HAMP domain-containing protein